MKKTFLFVLLLIAGACYAQDESLVKKNELGLNIITFEHPGTNYQIPNSTTSRFLPGLFYRYTKNRIGYRVQIDYSETNTKRDNVSNCYDCTTGNSKNKSFDVKIGIQYSLMKRNSYLLAISDLYYKNTFSKGHAEGGLFPVNYDFASTANGIGLNFGLGSKIKFFRRLFISPELYMDFLSGTTKIHNTNLWKGSSDYSNMNLSSLNGLNLRVIFTFSF